MKKHNTSLPDRVFDGLLGGLAQRQWSSGARLPPVRELARCYGVSRMTMLAAIHKAADCDMLEVYPRRAVVVREGAAGRAEQLLAERQASNRLWRLAVLVPDRFMPLTVSRFYLGLVTAVISEATTHGAEAEVVVIHDPEQMELADTVSRRFDAAFAIGVKPQHYVCIYALAHRRFPLTVFNRTIPGIDVHTVRQDDYTSAMQLAKLLASLGHRDMCLVALLPYEMQHGSRGHLAGWLDFLRESGLIEACSMPVASVMAETLDIVSEKLLRNLPNITALVVPPNLLWRIAPIVQSRGLRIPGDLSLATTGAVEPADWPPALPPVTSCEIDVKRFAECALETINHCRSGQPAPLTLRLPVSIHITESIGRASPRRQ